jgi:glycosyltransferase involved in cell wall biosynthesis
MNNIPVISVVMPVYNGERFLREAIESILNQTYREFEFLIICDKSTDNTLSIIQEFQKQDERIVLISGDKEGITGALNKGIKKAKGKYIARLDADDASYPERLEMQYKFMVENKLDICGGDYISIDQDGLFKKSYNVVKEDFEILLTMASNVPFAHPSVMIKKSFLIDHKLMYGVCGHKIAEDLDLWMNMYNAGAKFGNIGIYILKYRLLSDSLSSINHRLIKREINKQFDFFVNNNHKIFKLSLELFCLQNSNSNNLQRVAIKALLRYLKVDFNFKLLYQCWSNVSLYNFIIGLLSYINSRLIIK